MLPYSVHMDVTPVWEGWELPKRDTNVEILTVSKTGRQCGHFSHF